MQPETALKSPDEEAASKAIEIRTQEDFERVEATLADMSLDEKLSLVSTNFPTLSPRFPQLSSEEMKSNFIPSAGFCSGVPRLGIPPLRETDAGLGVANPMDFRQGDTATAYPSALATAASFSTDLAFAHGAAVGAEARAKGFNVLLAGGANLTRDPWGGRNFEYFGEDPLLVGKMAAAEVAGVQSNRIASTVKHFVLNPQETGRMAMDACIEEAALRESDLLAFQLAIEGGRPASVMSAYNKINGIHASEHRRLNIDILKGEWGFDGWIMSDWGGVHSTIDAVEGGLDQESGIELDFALQGKVFFTDALKESIENGTVPITRLDDMVRRILTGLLRAGVLDDAPSSAPMLEEDRCRTVAQDAAAAGIVLLRNVDDALPLTKRLRRVLLVGGHADVGVLSGGGSSQVLSARGNPIQQPIEASGAAWFARVTYHGSSPLVALRAAALETEFTYVSGEDVHEAARLAGEAEAAIVFATQWMTEGIDAESLTLPHEQDELIGRVASANSRTIVVLQTGGPVLMPWVDEVSAVLAAWYPGDRGGEALASILVGETAPGGRLPMTFPVSQEHAPRPVPPGIDLVRAQQKGEFVIGASKLPTFTAHYQEGANVGYRWYETAGHTPLFPFGFGLTYSCFQYEGLEVTSGCKPTATFSIQNVGDLAGIDVPQIYVKAVGSDGLASWRLAAFSRVLLEAGEKQVISLELETRCFSKWCDVERTWIIDRQSLPLALARSATDHILLSQIAVI